MALWRIPLVRPRGRKPDAFPVYYGDSLGAPVGPAPRAPQAPASPPQVTIVPQRIPDKAHAASKRTPRPIAQDPSLTPTHRAGLVALIGRPNVGKSTLLNALISEKLAITSPRPQTTRHRLLGILSGDGYQIGFLDTPGFMRRARDQLDRRMRARIREAMDSADLAVLVAPASPPGELEGKLIADLRRESKPALLAINKVDRVRKSRVLPVIEDYARLYPFLDIVPISALLEDGTEGLRKLIVSHLPEAPPLYDVEEITDRSERFLAAQLVAEQLFRLYGQEVPYDTAVEVEEFQEADGVTRHKDLIRVVVYVHKPAQRRILIGHGGSALKEVGTAARQEIERLFGREVFLELWVKAQPNWRQNDPFLDDMGF